MRFISKYNVDYFMLLNRPKRIVPGYLIFNNVYIKKELLLKILKMKKKHWKIIN